MNNTDNKDEKPHKYDSLLHKTRELMEETEKEFAPKVQYALDTAKEKLSALEELTVEETEKLADYLKRDLVDAAEFGGELKDWLQFETALIEDRLLDAFSTMVDHTREELDRIRAEAIRFGEWHTGEITSIGTLQCKQCGELLHFHKSGHIPPCPKCQGTSYKRSAAE